MKIDGITQLGTVYLPFSMLINKIWGDSSNDLYVVGNNGNVAYYQNGVRNKIESGIDLPINDIWGSNNSDTGEDRILCVASNQFVDQESEVIKIIGDETVKINNTGLS